MRLTAFSLPSEPRRSRTFARGRPWARARPRRPPPLSRSATATRSPSRASPRSALGNREFAPLCLLVDRHEPRRSVLLHAQDAERANSLLRDHPDDPAYIGEIPLGAAFFDVQQHIVARARCRFSGFGASRKVNENARRRALRFDIPIRGRRNEITIRRRAKDHRDEGRRQGAGAGDGLAATIEEALRLHVLEECLQPDAIRALDREGARDLALADRGAALALAREVGENIVARGQGGGRARSRSLGQAVVRRRELSGLVACRRRKGHASPSRPSRSPVIPPGTSSAAGS